MLPEIFRLGLLQRIDDDHALLLGQVDTLFNGSPTNSVHPDYPLRITTLAPDTTQFDQFLKDHAQSFISWLWQIVDETKIAYAFIAPESYAAYYVEGKITSELVFRQVGHLIATGTVEIVHPVMFFAEHLGQVIPALWRRKHLGILLM